MIATFLRRAASAVAAAVLLATPAAARSVTDSAGRQVEVPDKVAHVLAAGPPASTMLYVLAPQAMVGWVRPPRDGDKRFLLPLVRDLPQTGRLTGRGDTVSLEQVVADKPDLILDVGTISDTYRSLADRVQAQTGIPYLLIDGRFANTAAAIRLLGDVLGVPERAASLAHAADAIFADVDRVLAKVPADKRPHVYLARGPEGLETGSRGSINTEIIERAGALNVVEGLRDKGGLVVASPEQIVAWAPDTIVTLDASFARSVATKPEWAPVPAVAAHRVFFAPAAPFGFIDSPPALNRLIGLSWLLHTLYPDQAPGALRPQVREFYHLFYQVDLSDADLTTILGPPSP